jgi:ATP-dependent Clp protease adaptor protein ClpS
MSDESPSVATETVVRPNAQHDRKTKRQPPYHVILWNDEAHTVNYVVAMLQQIFGHPQTKGRQIAEEVHVRGKAVVLTTAKEHAEFKRDQIHAHGKDTGVDECKGSMSATIEPSE